jgi:hypothetical protein
MSYMPSRRYTTLTERESTANHEVSMIHARSVTLQQLTCVKQDLTYDVQHT